MNSTLSNGFTKKLGWISFCLFLIVAPARAQSEINLNGAIDFHVHSGPDSTPRSIDADDLARLAKQMGMRGLVLKNHFESTASLAYMVRKEVPGLEVFGGITMDLSNGGINLEAVKRMILVKGGWGRIVWLPTQDAENDAKMRKNTRWVPIQKDGKLLPEVLELMDFIGQHPDMVLETGHISAEEVLLVVHEAHLRGLKHVVVTHAMYYVENMSIPQMQQAARDGAFIEFDADGPFVGPPPRKTNADYAEAIRQIGPQYCLLATNFGSIKNPPYPPHPQGLLNFMNALHKEGLSVDDVNLMAKTNTALALGLKP
jgi:uncharacterized protein DUF6282